MYEMISEGSMFPDVPIVSYTAIRDTIKSGDILLCSGTRLFSRLIQRATGSVWSHIALVYRVESLQRVMLLESVESIGVRSVPLSHYLRNYNGTETHYPGRLYLARHKEVEVLSAERWQTSMQYALDRLGNRYDREEIVRIATMIVAPFLATAHEDIREARPFICSQYIAGWAYSAGIAVKDNPRGYIAPSDFAQDPAWQILWELI